MYAHEKSVHKRFGSDERDGSIGVEYY